MKGNRLINFALAAVTLLWGIPHAFRPAAAQAASSEAPHWGEGGVPQFQIDPDWPKIPSKWKVGFGSAVVGDSKGNVWILRTDATITATILVPWDGPSSSIRDGTHRLGC